MPMTIAARMSRIVIMITCLLSSFTFPAFFRRYIPVPYQNPEPYLVYLLDRKR